MAYKCQENICIDDKPNTVFDNRLKKQSAYSQTRFYRLQ